MTWSADTISGTIVCGPSLRSLLCHRIRSEPVINLSIQAVTGSQPFSVNDSTFYLFDYWSNLLYKQLAILIVTVLMAIMSVMSYRAPVANPRPGQPTFPTFPGSGPFIPKIPKGPWNRPKNLKTCHYDTRKLKCHGCDSEKDFRGTLLCDLK
ncbi:Abaecin [Vespula squamosa]|uniref:Abaecin n=1 Tax=Vespula squamosa TaxID=30214 RepID=A0ABD2BMP8_VESSQ